jgi:hypothetical protein
MPSRTIFRTDFLLVALVVLATVTAAMVGCGDDGTPDGTTEDFSSATFAHPPREAGPIARWWWPGGAVDDGTLHDALADVAEAGYARVEMQPLLLGLTDTEVAADPRIRTVGDAAFLAHLRTVAETTRELGLGWDLTLGSGWPSGAPEVTPEESAQQLLTATAVVEGPGAYTLDVPRPQEPGWVTFSNKVVAALGPFDEDFDLVAVLRAPLVDESGKAPVLGAVTDVTGQVQNGVLAGAAPEGRHLLIAVWHNRVEYLVWGGAFPGAREDAHVVDHLDPNGVQAVLRLHGDGWLDALDGAHPSTVFVDSFELIGELPWTPRLADRFSSETGLDAAELLPFFFRANGENWHVNNLFGDGGPRFTSATPEFSVRAREEYEAVREATFHDGFVAPLAAWGRERGVAIRLQAHGGWGDVLDDDATADVPESEGLYGGGSFDFLKLASSAAHVAGRSEATSESFVLINPTSTTPLTQDDFWRLAGRAFAAGITRLVHHGVPYPYTRMDGKRWYPFSGGGTLLAERLPISSEIRPGEPAWSFLPDFNRAQARLTYALTRGEPRAEVAWLHAARQYPQRTSSFAGTTEPEAGESATSRALRRAGYGYDRVSRSALADATFASGMVSIGAARYRALLVGDDLPAAEPELVEALQRAIEAGVPVLLASSLPTRATGLRDAEARDACVRAAASAVDAGAEYVAAPDEIPPALARRGVHPPLSVLNGTATLSTLLRELSDGRQLVFVFNEGRGAAQWTVRLADPAARVELFDPETGAGRTVSLRNATDFDLELPAARARVLLVGSS